MAMTRKHYIAIADWFFSEHYVRLGRHEYHKDGDSTTYYVASKLQIAELFASCINVGCGNSTFDRGRFVRRCMRGCSDTEHAKRQRKLRKQAA